MVDLLLGGFTGLNDAGFPLLISNLAMIIIQVGLTVIEVGVPKRKKKEEKKKKFIKICRQPKAGSKQQ